MIIIKYYTSCRRYYSTDTNKLISLSNITYLILNDIKFKVTCGNKDITVEAIYKALSSALNKDMIDELKDVIKRHQPTHVRSMMHLVAGIQSR